MCRNENISVSGPILQEKARFFASQFGIPNFKASDGWLSGFKKRHDIVFRKICGESASVDTGVCVDWKAKLGTLAENYSPEDIYNAEETHYFFSVYLTKLSPSKTKIRMEVNTVKCG